MENKINIAELLKDCPKGMELYSPLCGKCVFDRLNMGTIICKKQNTQEITFTSEGYYMLPVFDNCECMIFPSKDQRDWSKFQRPFKDGDIVAVTMTPEGIWIGIFKQYEENFFDSHCSLSTIGEFHSKGLKKHSLIGCRPATEEEKEKLFDAIKVNGYKWNAETKTLEKLIEPKFKVGDRVKRKEVNYTHIVTIVEIDGEYYTYVNQNGEHASISIKNQDKWELVPNKFDITTLKPFESRVLVRDYDNQIWIPTFWGKYLEDSNCRYLTTNGCYKYCIPDEGNHHLLGTTNDCDDYYKTWEE